MYHEMIIDFMSDLAENERYCGEFILKYGFYYIILEIKDNLDVELIRVEKWNGYQLRKHRGSIPGIIEEDLFTILKLLALQYRTMLEDEKEKDKYNKWDDIQDPSNNY